MTQMALWDQTNNEPFFPFWFPLQIWLRILKNHRPPSPTFIPDSQEEGTDEIL